jgi:hypothetical protein
MLDSAVEDRFWSKVRRHPTDCWDWTAAKVGGPRGGYGVFSHGGKDVRANRAKLSEADALLILGSRERGVDLARRFGVSPQAVCDIRKGRKWGHL